MRLAVTGASGRLGRHLVQAALAEGHQVVSLDLAGQEPVDIRRDDLAPWLDGCDAVIHSAALHGRHLDLGLSRQAFIDTNVSGTLRLLEAAKAAGVGRFLYTSTTSIYGAAMDCPDRAVWVDEDLAPRPRDIYDISKQAAEHLCRDFFAPGFTTAVLRVSRFMDEPANAMANYRLYRGLDERDGALAHLKALSAPLAGFEIFNISNRSPFQQADLGELKRDAAAVVLRYYPDAKALYRQRGWQLPASIDRVYVTAKAERLLGYRPKFNFDQLLGL
ncbi:NAD(P)-dependent oxidoreductase [Gallaecimonas kandeliae]|uniref:NAD-dependent epimerase/dehydratase family protein n=1 Tax=Gallaecimonas kandeliae TaxID=3029055 RepID=UPI0026476299|nr:NAD(P)-dependent oxidoreductase [Gallaecimonas kandeliae]WKE63933.1 NAD(P)-dependent oxidoreductase [Gallaecimonas kandeliae]